MKRSRGVARRDRSRPDRVDGQEISIRPVHLALRRAGLIGALVVVLAASGLTSGSTRLASTAQPRPVATAAEPVATTRLVLGLRDDGLTPAVQAAVVVAGGQIVRQAPEIRAIVVSVPSESADAAVVALRQRDLFRYVERETVLSRPEPPAPPGGAPRAATQEAFAVTNDPFIASQWNLPVVNAPGAWGVSMGDPGVTVAVIDSGFDMSHPDRPINLVAGPDYVEDGSVRGDPNGHGTHVTGIVAAATNNGTGVASLAPNVRVMVVRVLDVSGSGSDIAAGDAIRWSTDNGARVINLSLGGPFDMTYVRESVAYAVGRGVLVVAASGNSGNDGNPVTYPGAYPGVMAVGATTSSDTVASYSTHHSYLSVSAPGSGILSTYPDASYRTISGTSMAAPHVAALAGLVWSTRPSLTRDQVRSIIETSAHDLGAPGHDEYYGWGRINACIALSSVISFGSASSGVSTEADRAPLAGHNRVVLPVIAKRSRLC